MLTGTAVSTGQRFAAAKRFTKKAVFCMDNIDPSLDADDVKRFVSSLKVHCTLYRALCLCVINGHLNSLLPAHF